MIVAKKTLLSVACIALCASSAQAWNNYGPYQQPNYWNGPVVMGSGQQTHYTYNPWQGFRKHTQSHDVHASAFNPTRNIGRENGWNVNRMEYDPVAGTMVHRSGYQWRNPITGEVHGTVKNKTYNPDGSTDTKWKTTSLAMNTDDAQ